MRRTIDIGDQSILSFLLGVIVFNTAPTKENKTTTQMAYLENSEYPTKTKLARVNTISENNSNNRIWTSAAILILRGKRPGYFPPIAISPQGIPIASAN